MIMKIVYDHQIFAIQEYGGISRYFYELASRIACYEGCEVCVHAPFYVNRYIKNNDIFKVIGVYVPRIPRTGRALMRMNDLFGRLFPPKDLPDIVHETYHSRYVATPAKSRTVITVYDMIHEKYKDMAPASESTSQNKASAVKRADRIICISVNTKKDLIHYFNVNPDKISVIYLGYSLNRMLSPQKLNIGDAPYILYVGQRYAYKNFHRLLQAYSLSQRLTKAFKIVCFGGAGFSKDELHLMEKLHLKPENIMHLSGSDDILSVLYSNAALFVFPSLCEGFGIPLLEAMSFRCPVVCSNTSSLPEVAGDAAEYFDPVNIEEMTRAMETVVFSTDRRRVLIEKGLQRINLFSWEKCAEQTLEVYSSLL